ncbi:MAG: hypothetical protein ACI8P9_004048 [Parasphingorhabdus sp.]|jgi:hypothetical protein
MEKVMLPLVTDIRAASCNHVREFGLMSRPIAGTDLSVSAVHSVIEIGKTNGMSSLFFICISSAYVL